MATAAEQETKRDGEAILWTLLAIAALAEVTDRDVAAAALLWSRRAPTAARGLVYAGSNRSPYRWDQRQLRYINPTGTRVSLSAVKQQVNTFVDDMAGDLADLTGQMNAGKLPINAWQTTMAQTVKRVHLAVDIVAQGGVDQIDQADVTRMTANVDYQLRKLLEFSRSLADLGSDRVRIPDQKAIDRARLYAETARTQYEASVAQSWADLASTGVTVEMRNILDPVADHCESSGAVPGCLDEDKRGWVPFGTMSLPGRRVCGAFRCKCGVDYRRIDRRPNLN